MARIGIFGFPNVGKTTLFNALTGLNAHTAPHPFSTLESNVGVAKVPDARLDAAARVENSSKVVYATLELLDLPLGHGGFDRELLGRLREMEALAIVLRAFDEPAVPADESGLDPVAQTENLLLELSLADGEVFARKAERVEKEATADAAKRRAADVVLRAAALLGDGRPLRSEEWTEEEVGYLRDIAPLTLRPAVWVVNTAEEGSTTDWETVVGEIVPSGDTVVTLSARIEEEGARLEPDERTELFEELGLGEGALAVMVRASHSALGLLSFYTLGPKEAHAWTVRQGSTVRRAAGKIHSDLERGFIRAEVASIDDVIDAGGWDKTKAVGKMRLEGQDYLVKEGDVIEVRFSV